MSTNTNTAVATGFQGGQRVRLTAPFTGRCMTYRGTSELVFGELRKPPRMLPRGTVLTVFVNPTPTDKRLESRCRKADPMAVLVCDADGGKWCIPTSMLEVVPETQGKEPGRDAQGSRLG